MIIAKHIERRFNNYYQCILYNDTGNKRGLIVTPISRDEYDMNDAPLITNLPLLYECTYTGLRGQVYYENDDEVIIFMGIRPIIVSKKFISNIDYTKANINKLDEI